MSVAPRSITATGAASGSLKRELGATLALGWPIILANVAIYAMTATDFIMLGRLSAHALAAGALGFNLFQPAMVLGIGVVAALAPIAAAKIGAGESGESLRRATHQSLLSAVALSAIAWIYLSQTERILACHRRIAGPRARRRNSTCAAISGVCCRTFCSSPPAASSPRLSGRARR